MQLSEFRLTINRLEKRRPGQDPGMNIVLAGFWQLYRAFTQIWQLKQSLAYLIGYFLLGDSLNTTVTVIATLQNSLVAYNTLKLTYLFLVGIFTQFVGIYSTGLADSHAGRITGPTMAAWTFT